MTNNMPVIVIGGGGHAKVLISILTLIKADVIGILDSNPSLANRELLKVPVLGGDVVLQKYQPSDVALVNGIGSIGNSSKRRSVFEQFSARGYQFRSVLHPRCTVGVDVEIGQGAQLMAGSIVQPGTKIGANTIINMQACIDHDCRIGGHAHIASGAVLGGGVVIGESCHVGAGATIIQNITIGDGSIIGAGAAVINDIAEGLTAVGVPARAIKRTI